MVGWCPIVGDCQPVEAATYWILQLLGYCHTLERHVKDIADPWVLQRLGYCQVLEVADVWTMPLLVGRQFLEIATS